MKYNFKTNLRKSLSLLAFFCLILMHAQTYPNLEMAKVAQDGNPTADGPTLTTKVNFVKNTNNSTGVNFETYAPVLAATYTLSNSAYTGSSTVNNSAVNFGFDQNYAETVFTTLNSHGAPTDGDFTSSGSVTNGTGISVAKNSGVRMNILTNPLRVNNRATNKTWPMADLTITFSRPVNNPIIHIGGFGGNNNNLGFTGRFDLASSNLPLTSLSLTRLSGNNATAFQVSGFGISNSSSGIIGTGATSGSGSVRINGIGITTLKFTISLRGDGGDVSPAAWAPDIDPLTGGDTMTVSFSTLESDLQVTKTVDKGTPNIGENVVFSIAAKNNGASNNTNVKVQDLLPSGYQFVSKNEPAGTTYAEGTGLWTIGNLDDGITKTLTVTAKVLGTGVYKNTAVISTTNATPLIDPVTTNDNSSVTPVPVALPDTDGDGIPDYLDLDDDNDGILDIDEECKGFYSQNSNGVWKGKTASNVTFTNTFATISDHQQSSAYASPQIKFNVNNGNGSEPRKNIKSASGTYTITFSQPVPASEIAFMVNDLDSDESTYASLTPTFTVKVNGVPDNGIFFKDPITTPVGGFNDNDVKYIYGIVTFPIRKANQGFFIRGVGETLVTSLSITGAGLSAAEDIGLSFYNRLYCDTDGDGLPNTLDLDSDNDGCSDSNEYYNNTTSAASGQQFGQTGGAVAPIKPNGTVNLPAATYTSTTLANVTVATTASISTQPVNKTITAGDTTTFTVNVSSTNTSVFNTTSPFAPNYGSGTSNSSNINYQWQTSVDNGANWTNVTNAGVYSGATSNSLTITAATVALNNNQYRAVIKVSNHVCTSLVSAEATLKVNAAVCYNLPATGTGVATNHGISLLQRAGAENGDWPMIRKGAHTVLESNTKGFVITRMTTAQVTAIVSPQEGMMVYDTNAQCLKLYDGTAWSCFTTPACP